MTINWPSLLRTARRLVRLTQEDFAADLGRSQSMVALWEAGRRPIPPVVRRRVLDILGGYYHRRPEYGALTARAAAQSHPVTLYRQGMIVQAANPIISSIWRHCRLDLIDTSILRLWRPDRRVFDMMESHIIPMIEGRSEVLSVAFNDRSMMEPDNVVRRTNTVVRVGEGWLLNCEDVTIRVEPGTHLPPIDLQIVTMDDISDASPG